MVDHIKSQDRDEQQNVFAFDLKHEPIHISDARSGRKGYFCMGCDREMQAVKSKILGRSSYFRHDPKDVLRKGKCTYSDETYRHKLAKEILVRLKQIKLPAVYKYPPKGEAGLAYLLKESETLIAHHVEVQRHFYETDNGEISWGSQTEANGKNLLIVPDVIFFNKENEPILFIELVVKHGITDEKKLKVRRLGINTVQVKVPKESPQEIEKSFLTTDKTKWVFNYEQEITDYLRISKGNSEGISSTDEVQRQFYEETFRCRVSQIGNLVRSIKRCLESKPYREIDEAIRSEISRVERNTESNRERLQRIQEEIDDEVYNGLGAKREELRIEENQIFQGENRVLQLFEKVQQRYKRKRESLETEKGLYESGVTAELKRSGVTGFTFSERKRDIEREIKSEELAITAEQAVISQLEIDTRTAPEKNKRLEEGVRRDSAKRADDEKSAIERIEEGRRTISERFEKLRGELTERFNQLRNESSYRIKERNIGGDTELSRRIKELLSIRGLLINYIEENSAYKRNRKAWESFKSGAYKSWDFERQVS
ncbi:MAG: hypothetical protein DI539_23935 [Flavobacterium psychrophilum]|nr:MAG: hypothetical protein DI539_23935 [Flavobacterium psychrophilum]